MRVIQLMPMVAQVLKGFPHRDASMRALWLDRQVALITCLKNSKALREAFSGLSGAAMTDLI